jgi:hypothetical protein
VASAITGKKQFLSNSHEEVSKAIAMASGIPLPIPEDSLTATLKELFNQTKNTFWAQEAPVWD